VGRLGISDGRLQKPVRSPLTARIGFILSICRPAFRSSPSEGEFLRKWQTPDHAVGRPTGCPSTATATC